LNTRHNSVVVVGEALVDIIRTGNGVTQHPGGGPANIAVGLGRLGVDVTLMTQIGSDDRGDVIREHLAASGVKLWPESIVDRPTSSATVTIDGTGAANYEFDIRWDAAFGSLPPRTELLHVGSIGSFMAPGGRGVRELMRRASAREISFDPNIRAALVGSHAAAVATFEQTAALATVVKLSDEDAQWLYPHLAAEVVLKHILGLGPRLAVMTRGATDALLATETDLVSVPSKSTIVADTIGAGDTYMASIIDFLVRATPYRLDRATLLSLGIRAAEAASITVSRPGADLPWSHELTSSQK
jgi:fructokinase